jgi:hypothetical protein
MSLQEIKEFAFRHPEQIEICWDKLDSDPKYKEDFETVVTSTLGLLPEIEVIYEKLISGENIVVEGESTSLDPLEREDYRNMVEEELFAGYQMLRMWDTYKKVINITKSGA